MKKKKKKRKIAVFKVETVQVNIILVFSKTCKDEPFIAFKQMYKGFEIPPLL